MLLHYFIWKPSCIKIYKLGYSDGYEKGYTDACEHQMLVNLQLGKKIQ